MDWTAGCGGRRERGAEVVAYDVAPGPALKRALCAPPRTHAHHAAVAPVRGRIGAAEASASSDGTVMNDYHGDVPVRAGSLPRQQSACCV